MKTISTDKYSEEKLERLKTVLENQAKTGTPRQYEIYINGLKVVGRTNDPQHFDNYKDVLTDDDRLLEVVIYGSHESCTRGNKYQFKLVEDKPQELNGSPSIEQLEQIYEKKMEDKILNFKKEHKLEELEKELAKTKADLKQAEEYLEKVTNELTTYKNKKLLWGNVNLAEATGMVLEGIARRNVHLIAKIPGGQALAGLIAEDNQQRNESPKSETSSQVSFEKSPQQNEELLQLLQLFEENLSESELEHLQIILEKFLSKRELILEVAELIK